MKVHYYLFLETNLSESINEKISKIEQSLDPVSIALMGLQLVSYPNEFFQLNVLEILHDAGYAYSNNFSLSNVVFEDGAGERASLFSFERC